jgi:hypothetical protein
MSEQPEKHYRVQITGPGFDVVATSLPDKDENDEGELLYARRALWKAFQMASACLPSPTLILAYIVMWHLCGRIPRRFETLRRAEEDFSAAAMRLIQAWEDHDAEVRQSLKEGAHS